MSGPQCHSQSGDCGKQTNCMTSMYIVYSLKSILLMFSRDLGQLFPQHPQIHYHTPPPSAGIVAGLGFCYAGWVLVKSLEKHQWLQRAAHRGKHCVQKIIFFEGTLLEDDHLEDGAVVPGQF